jgi:hypothetical protein
MKCTSVQLKIHTKKKIIPNIFTVAVAGPDQYNMKEFVYVIFFGPCYSSKHNMRYLSVHS